MDWLLVGVCYQISLRCDLVEFLKIFLDCWLILDWFWNFFSFWSSFVFLLCSSHSFWSLFYAQLFIFERKEAKGEWTGELYLCRRQSFDFTLEILEL